MLDNSALIEPFVPETDDGDTFIYTETLDRGSRKGNNGHRLVKTFYHRSREEFWDQIPAIHRLCDLTGTRACTRLSPRSWSKVGRTFARLVMDAATSDNWAGMKSLYNRACGTTGPNRKYWLFDVDPETTTEGDALEAWLREECALVTGCPPIPLWVATIPSKKGKHLVCNPFDLRRLPSAALQGAASRMLHKDNPTNLYIPEGAA